MGVKPARISVACCTKSNVHVLFPKHHDEPLGPREEWDEKAGEMAALFGDFIKRAGSRAA